MNGKPLEVEIEWFVFPTSTNTLTVLEVLLECGHEKPPCSLKCSDGENRNLWPIGADDIATFKHEKFDIAFYSREGGEAPTLTPPA
jgi:hypothetical protein